jgi:hypothetical protein
MLQLLRLLLLHPAIMARNPDPTITVPVPVSSYPDNSIGRWSRTIFHPWRWSRVRATLNHDSFRWRRGWLSVNNCFCAAAESEQRHERHRGLHREVERKFHTEFSLFSLTADSINRCDYTLNFEAPVLLAFSTAVPKGTPVMDTIRLCNVPCEAVHRRQSLRILSVWSGREQLLLQLSEKN